MTHTVLRITYFHYWLICWLFSQRWENKNNCQLFASFECHPPTHTHTIMITLHGGKSVFYNCAMHTCRARVDAKNTPAVAKHLPDANATFYIKHHPLKGTRQKRRVFYCVKWRSYIIIMGNKNRKWKSSPSSLEVTFPPEVQSEEKKSQFDLFNG